jgi:hypothetical protein
VKCSFGSAALVVALGLGGCQSRDKFEGSLHARGGELGNWDFEPEICYSGEPEGFFGVDLSDFDGYYYVRFVDDVIDGATLVPFLPGSNTRRSYLPEECDVFSVDIERTNIYIDDIQVLNGDMEVDCNTEAGHFYGAVHFEGCH